MEKQIEQEHKKLNNNQNISIQGNFLFRKLSLSIGVALFFGTLTYIITGALKNKKNKGNCSEKNVKDSSGIGTEYKEGIPLNNLDKIDSGSRVFKVKNSIRNNSERVYWRAKKRFITG